MSLTALLQFCDSFDHYSIGQITTKWSTASGGPSFATGRNGNALLLPSAPLNAGLVSKTMNYPWLATSGTLWMVGFAYQFVSPVIGANGGNIYYPTSSAVGGYIPFNLGILPDGTLCIFSGTNRAVILFTDSYGRTPIPQQGVWYYIELMYQITGGSMTNVQVQCALNVNGVSYGTATFTTNIVTPVAGANVDTHNWVGPASSFGGILIDDVYIAVPGSLTSADFYGDVKILCYFPTSNDASNQWGGSYVDINSNPSTDTAPYVQSSTAGQKSMFGFQQITGSASYLSSLNIPAVMSWLRMDPFSSSERIQVLWGSFSLPQFGSLLQTIGSPFYYYPQPWDTQPGTSFVWTSSAFNTNEFGVYEQHT